MSRLIVKRFSTTELGEDVRVDILRINEDFGGTVFHEITLNEIASEVYKTRLTYFIAYKNDRIIGFCPCHSIKNQLVVNSFSNLSSYEIPYGGWIYDPYQVSYRELLIQTQIKPNEGLAFMSNIDLNPQKKYLCLNKTYAVLHTLVLKLEDSDINTIYLDLPSKQRNKIKRAYKIDVKLEDISPDDFDNFWILSKELKQRVGLELRDYDYYKNIFSYYYNIGRAKCIAASYKGELISAMILLSNRNYTIAWVAGRKSDIPNNLYQNEMLFWESIKWGATWGSRYFDFCGLDEEKLPHLARMKLSFSNDVKEFYAFSKRNLIYRFLGRIQGYC